MHNHAQLLSAIEDIDGSNYFDGLQYEHFLQTPNKAFITCSESTIYWSICNEAAGFIDPMSN